MIMEQPGLAKTDVNAWPVPVSVRVRHLLSVARAEFVARGFEAVSIDSIARAGGISKETIYRHFPDKEVLFRAALDAAGEEFTARTAAVHDIAATPDIELAGLARAILDTALDQGMFSALWVAASVAQRMPDLAETLQQGQWQRLEPVRQALEDYARHRGVIRAVPLELALDFGSLAVEGPAVLMGFPATPPAGRDLIARRVALLFSQGIGAAKKEAMSLTAEGGAVEAAKNGSVPHHIRGLLEVAGDHFLDHGYEGASLDDIGAQARVGRGTLYRHFGSKAGLFAAAVRHVAYASALAASPPALPMGQADRADLSAFLETMLIDLASPRSIRLHRLAISQSRRDAAAARDVYAILREPWLRELVPWLESLGLAHDPIWYARQLLVLALRGNRLFAGRPISSKDRRLYAGRAAVIFLDGFIDLI